MVESAPAKLLHHRENDPPGSDFRHSRYVEEREVIIKKNGSYQKWITGMVGAGLIAMLGYLGARDRVSVDAQFGRLDVATAAATAKLAEHEAQIQVMKTKQDRVLADLQENSRKLDLLLAEMRRR